MEPPTLSQYPDNPVYDVTTLAQLLRVRPLALWAWEQQLGISSGDQNQENGHKRRYSERDLIALMWLRDMVIAGESPQAAAARLLAAQRGKGATGYLNPSAYNSGALNSGALNSGALNSGALNSSALNSGALQTPQPNPGFAPTYDPSQMSAAGESWIAPTGNLGGASYPSAFPGMNPASSGPGMRPAQPGYSADPWNTDPWTTGSRNAPDTRPGALSGQLRPPASGAAPQMGGPSGRLDSVYGMTLEPPAYSPRGPSMSQSLISLRELRPAVPQLLQSFARFDTARADAVLMEALRRHGAENVCIGLVQPAVTRISELWSKSEFTNPEERFALNYLRMFMGRIYSSTQEPLGAPFAVVGCAPNETSDFSALLLAVLWRRAGMRVVYLGRGLDSDQLLQQHWPITPAIIALTATTSQRIRALARIGKKLGELPAPQPIFAYYGSIFVRNPDLRRKITGIYLGDDAATATQHARQLLNLDVFE